MSLRYSNIRKGRKRLGDTFRGLEEICGSLWMRQKRPLPGETPPDGVPEAIVKAKL